VVTRIVKQESIAAMGGVDFCVTHVALVVEQGFDDFA
jgi:hypothetical protein